MKTFFAAFALFSQIIGARCSDYLGFWIADYDKPDHRDYIELYIDGNLNQELRETYYRKIGESSLLYGHQYGRLKDSLGKCFGITDTARQVDSAMAPSGRVHFGEWFEFDYTVKYVNGRKMIHEVTADTIEIGGGMVAILYDTLQIEYVSEHPVFLNKFLFQNPSAAIRFRSGSNKPVIPWNGYRVDGRRGGMRREPLKYFFRKQP